MNSLISGICTFMVCLAVVLIVGLVIFIKVSDKKKGKSSCGCGCGNCPVNGTCEKPEKKE